MKLNFFSVVITTFNRRDVILKCLDSLRDLDYPKSHYEIIIVNNNSSDDTEDAVLEYIEKHTDVEIRYFFVPRPGQVYARQIGILAARNEILSFTDDDGLFVKEWLTEVNKVFNISDEIVGVAGKIEILWDKTPPAWIKEYEEQLGKLDYGDTEKVEVGLYMNAGNLHIKKDVLIDVGGFNPEMVGDLLVGDGETGLWLRLRKKNMKIGWSPKAVMYHCQIVDRNATLQDIERRFRNNGICIPYNIYAIDKLGKRRLIFNMLYAAKQSLKWKLKKIRYIVAKNERHVIYAALRSSFYSAQVPYSLKILTNKEFRTAITKNDWKVTQSTNTVRAI